MAFIPISTIAIMPQKFLNDDYFGPPEDPKSPHLPGSMSEPFPDFSEPEINKPSHQHKIDLFFTDDDIIELIQQLNETLYLGFLENLTAFGPKETGTSACEAAGDYIYNEFLNMGLDVRYHNWSYGGDISSNIEATIEGINESSDEIFIICAHYDTVSTSPGADDDGSGVAIVMAAAYLMNQHSFNHTVRFVAFSGEEQGLLGSGQYAEDAYVNGDNIIAVLNADMIGYADTGFAGNNVKIFENTESEWITDFTDIVSQQYYEYINLNVIPSGYSAYSDHFSFWQFGYDAIFYHENEFNPFYHSPQDIIENMNITYATKISKLMLATLAILANTHTSGSPPDAPIISGPTNGTTKILYEYSFATTDPDEDDVFYFIDWDDSTNSGWIGPYPSGITVNITHEWITAGNYEIIVKARDIYEAESNWSEPLSVEITDEISPSITILKPTEAIYVANKKIIPFFSSLIIGEIDIIAYATDDGSEIERVEFYVNDVYKANSTTYPYSWTWNERVFFKHTIKAIAFDEFGNSDEEEITVWKIF